MLIVWDEPKRLMNLAKHGLDFAAFEAGFAFDVAITVPSNSSETRFKLIGVFEDRVVVAAVLAPLGTKTRSLISLRPASRSERRLYENA